MGLGSEFLELILSRNLLTKYGYGKHVQAPSVTVLAPLNYLSVSINSDVSEPQRFPKAMLKNQPIMVFRGPSLKWFLPFGLVTSHL